MSEKFQLNICNNNRYYKFTKVGHCFLDQDRFCKLTNSAISLFVLLERLSFTDININYSLVRKFGFDYRTIVSALESLESYKLISVKRKSGFHNGITFIDIIINDIREINNTYWAKKNKIKISKWKESSHGQIPWILTDPKFFFSKKKTNLTKLKNRIIPFYLYLTQFYTEKEGLYVYSGSLKKFAKNIKMSINTLKKIIFFMEDKNVLSCNDNVIVLNHDDLMDMNVDFFKNDKDLFSSFGKESVKEKISLNVCNNKEQKTKKEELKAKRVKKTLKPKIPVRPRQKKGFTYKDKFFAYKCQKITWKEATDENRTPGHLADQYFEEGFFFYEDREPTKGEIVGTAGMINRIMKKYEWDINFVYGLLSYLSDKKCEEGYKFAFLPSVSKEYKDFLEDQEEMILRSETEEDDILAINTINHDPNSVPNYPDNFVEDKEVKDTALGKYQNYVARKKINVFIFNNQPVPEEFIEISELVGIESKEYIDKLKKHNKNLLQEVFL